MATILLIDEEPDDLTLTSMLLSVEGHRTMRACEARHALALALRSPPDVVVIDSLQFEGGAGTALYLALQADARTRHIPIVLVDLQDATEVEEFIACIDALIADGAWMAQS